MFIFHTLAAFAAKALLLSTLAKLGHDKRPAHLPLFPPPVGLLLCSLVDTASCIVAGVSTGCATPIAWRLTVCGK